MARVQINRNSMFQTDADGNVKLHCDICAGAAVGSVRINVARRPVTLDVCAQHASTPEDTAWEYYSEVLTTL